MTASSSDSKINRRRFLKYVGAGAVAAGGAATAYYLYGIPLERKPEVPIPTTTRINRPPVVSEIKIRPSYINPTTEYVVQFSHDSYDPDGDHLITTWLIDWKEVSHEPDYSTKLPEGHHSLTLKVSDGKSQTSKYATVTVDPDQIYPTKPLHLKYKGVRYFVGPMTPEWVLPSPSNEEMDEQLDTIHDDLGCNAIIVVGGEPSEDRMIECGEIAIDKGFERVYLQPGYINATVDETIEKIGRFAAKVRTLREQSDTVVYMVGHEFVLETAIIRGQDFFERFRNANKGIDWDKVRSALPRMFKRIIDVCDTNYGYPISYAATPPEAYDDLVPWSHPSFESVGIDAYIHDFLGWDENWMIDLLNRLKRYRKPVHCPDFGMTSYAGADKWGGWSPLYVADNPYDEEPQGRFTRRTLDMFNRARIDGCFWVQYNDIWDKGHGLYHPVTRKRKKGFYMYKSYQRTP